MKLKALTAAVLKMYFMGLRMGKIVEWVVSPITGLPPKPRNAQERSETL